MKFAAHGSETNRGLEILIIEDDALIRATIKSSWSTPSDRLSFVSSYKQTLRLINSEEIRLFDGIIADISLPDGSGLELLCMVKQSADIPTVLISGWGTPESRADALDQGADDYLMKPFHTRELQSRLSRAISSRMSSRRTQNELESFSIGDVYCDVKNRTFAKGAGKVSLTDMELRIISCLFSNRNHTSTRSLLSRKALFRNYDVNDKTLDVYVSRIRQKLQRLDGESADCIQTVRGSGYRLTDRSG